MELLIHPITVWFILGIIFFVFEFFNPAFIVLFFGIGSWVVSLCLLFFDISLTFQLIIFILVSVVTLLLLRAHFIKKLKKADANGKSDLKIMDEYVGKTALVKKDFKNNFGKIFFRGTFWEAETTSNDQIKKGDYVKIINCDNLLIKVEPIKRKD